MLLSAVSVLVVTQSSSEIPEGLMNNPVHKVETVQLLLILKYCYFLSKNELVKKQDGRKSKKGKQQTKEG